MSWLEKILPSITSVVKKDIPKGLWSKCPKCETTLYSEELKTLNYVCPKCDYHIRLTARARIDGFLDKKGQKEVAADLSAVDPLKFKDQKKYKDRYLQAQRITHEKDALVVKIGTLNGIKVVVVAFEFKFMGGSMGSVVGEKFVRAAKISIKTNTPLICFSASGGARMQEGLFR